MSPGPSRLDGLIALVLVGLAFGWCLLGTGRTLEPRDLGFILQRASRTAAGELPHRDFGDPYTGPLVLPGTYSVRFFLLRDGKLIAASSSPLQVNKTGVNAEISAFAHENAVFYGLLAILIAGFLGWLAAVILRRD